MIVEVIKKPIEERGVKVQLLMIRIGRHEPSNRIAALRIATQFYQ